MSAPAIRTFVCLEIPASIRSRIAALQQSLKSLEAQASWVKPDNIHLTLKFLGDVPAARIHDVRAAVERAAAGTGPIEIEVSGAGGFPSARGPRVLWVGLAEIPEALRGLQQRIEEELAGAGFARESKRFSPHLTIARLRSPDNARALAERLLEEGFAPERFTAREVIVMRSDLTPKGSIYTPQAAVAL